MGNLGKLFRKYLIVNKLYYFFELLFFYDVEIQDFFNDLEGKLVFKVWLKEKCQELKVILLMIEFSLEMVVLVFYDGFFFINFKVMVVVVMCELEDGDFFCWDKFFFFVMVESWVSLYVDVVLVESVGEEFMVIVVCLEFIWKFDIVG